MKSPVMQVGPALSVYVTDEAVGFPLVVLDITEAQADRLGLSTIVVHRLISALGQAQVTCDEWKVARSAQMPDPGMN